MVTLCPMIWSLPSSLIVWMSQTPRTDSFLTGFHERWRRLKPIDAELYRRGLQLDAVLELKVGESVLVERVRTRAEQMAERAEPVRSDDTPEVCERRLDVDRAQTAHAPSLVMPACPVAIETDRGTGSSGALSSRSRIRSGAGFRSETTTHGADAM